MRNSERACGGDGRHHAGYEAISRACGFRLGTVGKADGDPFRLKPGKQEREE